MATNDASTPGKPHSRSSDATSSTRAMYAALAKRLLGSCPPREGADPEIFITAIITIMMHYPVAIVEEVVDPFHGLPSQLKFPPTPYDVRQACEAVAERLARIGRSGPPLIPRKQIEGFVSPDPAPGPNGVHQPGTILSNFTEATKLYGKPLDKEWRREGGLK